MKVLLVSPPEVHRRGRCSQTRHGELWFWMGWWLSSEKREVLVPPGARVRPLTNYWVSYQPTIGYLTNFFSPWQPMLLMIQVQVQRSFYQFFPPPATHAFNDSGSSTTFLLSRVLGSPPLATHACNDGFRMTHMKGTCAWKVPKLALFTQDLHHITMRTQDLEICGDSFVL